MLECFKIPDAGHLGGVSEIGDGESAYDGHGKTFSFEDGVGLLISELKIKQ